MSCRIKKEKRINFILMEIENKFNLRDEVYIGSKKALVYAVSKDANWIIEYRLWSPESNEYSWFEWWQISKDRELIWFNDNEKE